MAEWEGRSENNVGEEKWSYAGGILKVEPTKRCVDGLDERGREESRMISRFV